MKEILYNPDKLKEKDITETVIRTKALIINKEYIYLAKEGTVYHFPGGHLEQNETLQECLKREVLEETGIELEENDIKEPFLKIIYQNKDWPLKGKNRKCEIYYYEIETQKHLDNTKTKYTEHEKEECFTIEKVPLNKSIQILKENIPNNPKNEVIAPDMIIAIKELESIKLKNSEHYKLLSDLVKDIEKEQITRILDAGSGKTSLSILLNLFPNAQIDGVVFYNDTRKINSIKENVSNNRYTLIEKDICKDKLNKSYDLVLAHLLLGEATKWGNTVEELTDKLLSIQSDYFIIFDIKEDPTIDSKKLEKRFQQDFVILKKEEIVKENPQEYDDFIARTYVAYLLKRLDEKTEN